jgi:hypothetical protein
MATKILPGTFEVTIFSQKRSNYHISLWRKVFFSFLTNVFFIHIKVAQCCHESPKIKQKKRSLIGNMVFGGFPKKIRNKTFYFHCKKKFHSNLFLLSFGPRVHFRSQTWTFMSNTPEYIFQSKTVKLSHFTLEKSIFSHINQFFFHSYQSCPMLRGVTEEKQKKRSLFGNMVFGGFPKKIRNKTFYFHSKKKNSH